MGLSVYSAETSMILPLIIIISMLLAHYFCLYIEPGMQCTYITKCCNNGWVGSGNHIEVDVNIQNDGPKTNEIVEVGTSKTNQPVDYVSRTLNL